MKILKKNLKKKIINSKIDDNEIHLSRINRIRKNRRFDFSDMNNEILLNKRTISLESLDIFDIKDFQREVFKDEYDFEYINLNEIQWTVLHLNKKMIKVLLSLNETSLDDSEELYCVYRYDKKENKKLCRICMFLKEDYEKIVENHKI